MNGVRSERSVRRLLFEAFEQPLSLDSVRVVLRCDLTLQIRCEFQLFDERDHAICTNSNNANRGASNRAALSGVPMLMQRFALPLTALTVVLATSAYAQDDTVDAASDAVAEDVPAPAPIDPNL